MAPREKRQGVSEYARKKDIHERVGVLEENAKHTAIREWVKDTLIKIGAWVIATVIGLGILAFNVWK